MRRFRKGPFTIDTSDKGLTQVYGWASNHIGIHHADRMEWSVTHLDSGRRFLSETSKKKAFAIAEALSRQDIDWSDKSLRQSIPIIVDTINKTRAAGV